jgi:hypothetical protein
VKFVEGLFKLLPAPGSSVTFLRYRVFGGAGNPMRHGGPDQFARCAGDVIAA